MPVVTVQSIRLTNFKRFPSFYFSAKKSNVLVGPNNSGKSSILDALRIAYACLRYTRSVSPRIMNVERAGHVYGYQLPLSSLPVPLANIATNYSDSDAVIEIRCTNGNSLFIRLNPERPIIFYATSDNDTLKTSKAFRTAIGLDLVIVPTLGPFEETEGYVTDETVQRNESGRHSNRHFRNIWQRKSPEAFAELASMLASSWPGIEIKPPEVSRAERLLVQMFYNEDRIDREVFWSGFGFQVWLQMLTHIMRGTENSILVIDEPDIYLHPDLQRKLLALARKRFVQFFMATHSVEIINEAETGDVASINPKHRTAKRISNEDEYQALFNYIGSYENIDFSRLARAKRIIFFEGKDRKLLRQLSLKVSATHFPYDTDTTILPAGGFSQWRRVKEVAWTFKEILRLEVKILVIFDRDYRSEEETQTFLDQMSAEGIQCFILKRKEVENYLLTISALVSAIQAQQNAKILPALQMTEPEILALISEISEGFRHDTFGQLVGHQIKFLQSIGSPKDAATISKDVSIEFEKRWSNLSDRLRILGGKDFIAALSTQLQQRKGFSITIRMLLDHLNRIEIDDDLKEIISALDHFCSI